jgi:DNA-binding MarR family transcriptional regulator
MAIHRKLIRDLKASGFDDLSPPHMAVIQYPGPDGMRPSALAERAAMSKQAMNQLLKTLEAMGYITRSAAPDESGGTIVHFTDRGRAARAPRQEQRRRAPCPASCHPVSLPRARRRTPARSRSAAPWTRYRIS